MYNLHKKRIPIFDWYCPLEGWLFLNLRTKGVQKKWLLTTFYMHNMCIKNSHSWVSHLMSYSLNTRGCVPVRMLIMVTCLILSVCRGTLAFKCQWILSKLMEIVIHLFILYMSDRNEFFLGTTSTYIQIIEPSRWCMQHAACGCARDVWYHHHLNTLSDNLCFFLGPRYLAYSGFQASFNVFHQIVWWYFEYFSQRIYNPMSNTHVCKL